MKTLLLRTAATALLGIATVLPLGAQQTPHDDHHEETITASGGVCGNTVWDMSIESGRRAAEQTRVSNPALYRQMQARVRDNKDRDRANLATIGDQFPFYVRDRVKMEYVQVPATEVAEGGRAKVWVEDAIAGQISPTKVAQLARALDTATPASSRNPNQGIIKNDIDVYGDPPLPQADDPYIHFLITDIKDGFTGGAFVAGYFYPYDQTSNEGSNRLNILYIDIQNFNSATGVNDVLNTMAHEFQHNIHYRTNPNSDIFYNEGCSEEASILCGYANRGNGGYRANTNINLLGWTSAQDDPTGSKTLADYERAMTFTHYIREQFGEGLLTVLNATRVQGIDRLDQALQTYGRTEHWQDVLRGFAVANYVVKNYHDPRFVYQAPILGTYNASNGSTGVPSPSKRTSGTGSYGYTAADFPTSDEIVLNPYGVGYTVYSGAALSGAGGGGLRPTFTWTGAAAVYAIIFRGNTVVGVRELNNGEAADIVESVPFTKIAFALVNLRPGGTNATISWTMERLASGVDVATDARSLAIAAITPNPAHENAIVELTAARGGQVELEVFDGAGAVVLTKTVQADAGRATVSLPTTELPSGAYLVRLRQGAVSATRSLVVAH